MAKRNSENSYNTNLASEFFVLSTLARLGINASLSLGNKKKVDIVVMKKDGTYLTIDVKGIAGKDDWILGDSEIDFSQNHFYALVSYEKKISEITMTPLAWVFSAQELKQFDLIKISKNEKTKYISYPKIRDNFDSHKHNWNIFNV